MLTQKIKELLTLILLVIALRNADHLTCKVTTKYKANWGHEGTYLDKSRSATYPSPKCIFCIEMSLTADSCELINANDASQKSQIAKENLKKFIDIPKSENFFIYTKKKHCSRKQEVG